MFVNNPNSEFSEYLFYINIVLKSPYFYVMDLNYLLIDNISKKTIKKGNVIHDALNSGCLTLGIWVCSGRHSWRIYFSAHKQSK